VGHEYQDKVSMELAKRVAAELPMRPELIELARNNLRRWSERNHDSPALLACYEEWRQILERPLPEIMTILVAATDDGQRLRQNSPFAGAVHYRDVWEIKRRLRDEAA
jgi:hypothetical protein